MTIKTRTHLDRQRIGPAPERLAQLNAIAITQMRSVVGMRTVKRLGRQKPPKEIEP